MIRNDQELNAQTQADLKTGTLPGVAQQPAFEADRLKSEILAASGLTDPAQIRSYLNASLDDLPDPRGLPEMDHIIDLVLTTKSEGKSVAIVGDKDVDGVASAVMLKNFFDRIGVESEIISVRSEGHGFGKDTVTQAQAIDAGLIIAVDCGTKAIDSVLAAKQAGLRIGIVDHHESDGLINPADAVCNPKLYPGSPFSKLDTSSGGLVFTLIRGFERKFPDEVQAYLPEALCFATLSIIGDVGSLVDSNRIIVKNGLREIAKTENLGLQKLLVLSSGGLPLRLDPSHISRRVNPLINAAHRVGDIDVVLELFTTKDAAKAEELANKLGEYNVMRREIEQANMGYALEILRMAPDDVPAYALFDDRFDPGVAAIIANRLSHRMQKPVAIMAPQKKGTVAKGSARCDEMLDLSPIFKELYNRGLLVEHGGHQPAVGFQIERANIMRYCMQFTELCAKALEGVKLQQPPVVKVKAQIGDITPELADFIASLGPFGKGNPEPLVEIEGARAPMNMLLREHSLRLKLVDDTGSIGGVRWGNEANPAKMPPGKINITAKVRKFGDIGREVVELHVVSAEPAGK